MIGRRAVRVAQQHLLRYASSSSQVAAAETKRPKEWKAPLEPGQLRAYDAAVAYIAQDRERKLALLEQRKKEGADEDELESIEIEAWINDPETRWKAKNGLGDLSKPVYRHMAEKEWRTGGRASVLVSSARPRVS